jgi:hypothetical protein
MWSAYEMYSHSVEIVKAERGTEGARNWRMLGRVGSAIGTFSSASVERARPSITVATVSSGV